MFTVWHDMERYLIWMDIEDLKSARADSNNYLCNSFLVSFLPYKPSCSHGQTDFPRTKTWKFLFLTSNLFSFTTFPI